MSKIVCMPIEVSVCMYASLWLLHGNNHISTEEMTMNNIWTSGGLKQFYWNNGWSTDIDHGNSICDCQKASFYGHHDRQYQDATLTFNNNDNNLRNFF